MRNCLPIKDQSIETANLYELSKYISNYIMGLLVLPLKIKYHVNKGTVQRSCTTTLPVSSLLPLYLS
jgi:hypothetical protein